jgi:hypothetical protein
MGLTFVAIASTKNGPGQFAKENGQITSRLLQKKQSCLGHVIIDKPELNILMLCMLWGWSAWSGVQTPKVTFSLPTFSTQTNQPREAANGSIIFLRVGIHLLQKISSGPGHLSSQFGWEGGVNMGGMSNK